MALVAIVGTGCAQATQADGPVLLRPGQDIQAIVADSAEGTHFRFEPGVYRQQTIYPKDRQAFIGQQGVVLNGAVELTEWTEQDGLWSTGGLPAPLDHHGSCQSGRDLCRLREDLFVDSMPYRRVASLDELDAGTWHYQDGRAWLRDDPRGRSIELGMTPLAIGGDAEDVVLTDLIVEKYATDAQRGAIEASAGRGWIITGVTARLNHGTGLSIGPQTRVTGGSFSHNGQLGMAAVGEDSIIEGVEIAFNNYAGYDAAWEAGGSKFAYVTNLVVRDSCVHHNQGPGLWTDIDNFDVLYEGNVVFANANDGIKHEISYAAIIRDNMVAYNGGGFDVWLWGSQILVQNSSNVEVHGNLVQVSAAGGNGIAVINQDRGRWSTADNDIYDNVIVHLGGHGQNGVVSDTEDPAFWREGNNRFDANTYQVADPDHAYWVANDGTHSWDEIRDLGYERQGALTVGQRLPVELSCAHAGRSSSNP